MYGWLLESVQHFIMQECGEEVWNSILREAGAKNTVFSARQQYPDVLMLRLASALANLVNKDATSPTTSTPASPVTVPKKSSFKSKPTWRSASLHTDGRTQNYKCPFTATNALTAATKKEIEAYNSSEEINAQRRASHDMIRGLDDLGKINSNSKYIRKSSTIRLENHDTATITEIEESDSTKSLKSSRKNSESDDDKVKKEQALESTSSTDVVIYKGKKMTTKIETSFAEIIKGELVSKNNKTESQNKTKITRPTSSDIEAIANKSSSTTNIPARKLSCSVALDLYNRRGSSATPVKPRMNSLNLISASNSNNMKEKFGSPEKVMHFFGRCFVKFFSNYGYDTMIRATGRYFCTFLQSVDNIHQRMRFTFPRMRSPSMQLTRAHQHGAELVYSSGRTGFTHYLMGQLYEIAEDIFSLKLKVSIVRESMEGVYYVAVLRLEFNNSDYVQSLLDRRSIPCSLAPVPASLLLQLFPFGVLLDRKMRILKAGYKLLEAWGGPYTRITKSPVCEILRLRKPKIAFTWDKVVCMQTVLFELELVRMRAPLALDARRGSQGARSILLKGPIHLLEEIDALVFLCSPIFNDLEELKQAGLYVADLNGHGLSKEMLLDSWQHLSRLELLFEKAETRSVSLEKSCRLLDQWKSRGDKLLYSMIPKAVVEHLRSGCDPMDTCQAFEAVTVMFCGVQLLETGTRADVMHTVAHINDVYSKIDRLLDAHRVYKVETVGTVYMVVAGAPERRRTHAATAASAALAVSRALPTVTIGIHSGPCVAGVLGRRLPRYCLVGDTVNTASRMQTTSEPGRVQISAATQAQLPAGRFRVRRRGLIKVKGKGMMETYWLEGEVEEEVQDEALQLFSFLCGDN